MEFLGAILFYCLWNTTTATRIAVSSSLAGCFILLAWYLVSHWLGHSDSPHIVGHFIKRCRGRMSGALDMIRLAEKSQDSEADEPEGRYEERKPTDDTICASPATEGQETRSKSRSLGLRFFARNSTNDSGPSRRPTEIIELEAV